MKTPPSFDASPPNIPRSTFWVLALCFLSLWHASGVLAQEQVDCSTCVEDVVVETHDGRWIGGYIYWSRPPFKYLDLERPGDQLRLQRHGQGEGGLHVWTDAVSVSRERWPEGLGEAPPLPPAPAGQWRGAQDVALLVGTPRSISVAEIRRIFPRIGSGEPAVEVPRRQMLDLVETNLPFQPSGGGECLGCPMTVEDVTLVLNSGEWVSGLMGWHVATRLQGYDLRDEPLVDGFWAAGDLDGHLEIWQEAVSGPRRRFKSPVFLDQDRNLQGGGAFHRIPESVLLTQAPRRIPVDEVAFLLPGPSRPTYPLHMDRTVARRLLLEKPAFFLRFSRDVADAVCLAYGLEDGDAAALRRLANICSKLAPDGSLSPVTDDDVIFVQSPWWARLTGVSSRPVVDAGTMIVVMHFDGGT